MNGFNRSFPVEGLRGAEYNPRTIDADTLEVLQRSIKIVGFAKPIIVTRDGLIVAGHQRTKAARAMGLEAVPAFVLDEITTFDEIRFNQLHNGTDLDDIDKPVKVPARSHLGFAAITPGEIEGDGRSQGARVRGEICRLLLRYGNWGCAVVTQSGEVVSSPQYLLSCKMMKMPARVYYIADDQVATAGGFFKRTYGKFSYEHLKRTTWIQTLAQPFRLRSGKEDKAGAESSVLYRLAIPYLPKGGRILDFGCGQGDYVRDLRSKGWNIRGIEFFRRKGLDLDRGAVWRMCDEIAKDIAANGLYDVVLSDSVVNSVDTLQAEADVMACLNAFAKPGALIFFSGRSREYIEEGAKATIYARASDRGVEPLDENGFSGMYREGTWFFQKFHSKAQAAALGERYIGAGEYRAGSANSWQYFGTKKVELATAEAEDAIRREFNLPWPDGDTVGKGDVMVTAWRRALEIG